jgi:hypothetical protein
MRSTRTWAATSLAILAACRFDSAYRDDPPPPVHACTPGAIQCSGAQLQTCSGDTTASSWQTTTDCSTKGLTCAPGFDTCVACVPAALACDGESVTQCDASGLTTTTLQACDVGSGFACRNGACVNLCDQATADHSNIGCEYWGADLDNAVISATLNAAAQQYAIVVSNANDDVPATVTIEQDNAMVGEPSETSVVGTAVIAPHNLQVFDLGPREVDGSPPGEFNTGTGTAYTRQAYRVTSTMPIVAYQFNPLDNVNVFSNDASQLLPVSGLSTAGGTDYVVAGWPQTIAITSNPATDFGVNLRAFLTILGTRADTHVHLVTTTAIIPGGPFPNGLPAGGSADFVLQPFDVMNLETGDFNADFTGSVVSADGPVALFPGSEASDAPYYTMISDRYCCADHLENQEPPVATVGKTYVLAKMPNRTSALIAAGAQIGEIDEPEFYRLVAVSSGTTHITTSLPSPNDAIELDGAGQSVTITSTGSFTASGDQPFVALDVQSSQDASGVTGALPGGDPSTMFVAPIEQWRNDYVLLTPDKYVFDYLVITAPTDASVYLDGLAVSSVGCVESAGDGLTATERGSPDPPYVVWACQLSYPIINPSLPSPSDILPGKQNDGVHRVQSDYAVGVIAYGFDSYVSYAYAGGTQLTEINVQ